MNEVGPSESKFIYIERIYISERECLFSEKEFYMRDCILNKAAYIACDGSKKDNLFRGYCVLTDAG